MTYADPSVYRAYADDELGRDGYPLAWHSQVKHEVRERWGNRCVRCAHPYVKGAGEWSPWEMGARENVNDTHLRRMQERAGLTVAAWGAIKVPYGWADRPEFVRSKLGTMHALAFTKDGHPRRLGRAA